MKDRLNTKDLMLRKNWHVEEGPACILCATIYLESRFRKSSLGGAGYHLSDLNFPIPVRITEAKHSFTGPCFMEFFARATWNTWKLRNYNFYLCYMKNMEAKKRSLFSEINALL